MGRILFLSLVVILLVSCNDDDSLPIPIQINAPSNFYALTVGNTWEYKYYQRNIDGTGSFVDTGVVDAVEITNTVNINSNIYYEVKTITSGNNGNYNYLPNDGEKNWKFRDSLGYLIDHVGGIKYANNNYDEHFVDQLDINVAYYLQLSNTQDNITTDAGDFSCLDNHFYLKDINDNFSNSTDHIYREDGKGEILLTKSFASQTEHFAEKRLESYTVQ